MRKLLNEIISSSGFWRNTKFPLPLREGEGEGETLGSKTLPLTPISPPRGERKVVSSLEGRDVLNRGFSFSRSFQ
jgi:hypothetical protein